MVKDQSKEGSQKDVPNFQDSSKKILNNHLTEFV